MGQLGGSFTWWGSQPRKKAPPFGYSSSCVSWAYLLNLQPNPSSSDYLKEEVVNYLGRSREIKETTSWKSPLNLVTKVIGVHSNELVEVEAQFQ